MADDQLYIVDKILGRKYQRGRRVKYLVRWRGFSSDHDSWEPYQNLKMCRGLIELFLKEQRKAETPLENSSAGKEAGDSLGKKGKKIIPVHYGHQPISRSPKTKNNSSNEGISKTFKEKKDVETFVTKEIENSVSHLMSSDKDINDTIPTSGLQQCSVKKSHKKKIPVVDHSVLDLNITPTNRGKKRKLTDSISQSNDKGMKRKLTDTTGQSVDKGMKRKLTDTTYQSNDKGMNKKLTDSSSQSNEKGMKKKSTDTTSQSSDKGLKNKLTDTPTESSDKGMKKKLTDRIIESNDKAVGTNTYTIRDSSLDKTSPDIVVDDVIVIDDIDISEDEDDDDDILYSLNSDCDIVDGDIQTQSAGQDCMEDEPPILSKEMTSSSQLSQRSKKIVGKGKRKISLIDSKKQSKDWLVKSGLLHSVSPPPLFTNVKDMINSTVHTDDPSKPSDNSLPDPVSPEASETYLADVPSSYPVVLTEEEPLNPVSLQYKSMLHHLPDHLHPSQKESKKNKGFANDANGQIGSSSTLIGSNFTSTIGREPVERRTSVRSTECAFRYKQIVVKKCFRYTQVWLNTQTVMKNALNPQVIHEVVSALNSAKYDDSHLVLFSSLGNVFCSGTDLHFLVSGDRRMAARQMADAIREMTKTFIMFPKPIIAAVSGAAVGLGVSLLALCDIVYASDKASFHLPYSQLSQTPEGCSSFTLPLTLGLPSANELLYGGRKITAMEAYQLGLVSQVFWPTLMMQEVIPRAQNMATCSAKALEATKLLVRSHHRTKMELTNETECNLLLERWSSVDCQRALENYISNEKNLSF